MKEQPVAIGNYDVVEQLSEFRIVRGGSVLFNGLNEIAVGPPFVADELVDEAEHGM